MYVGVSRFIPPRAYFPTLSMCSSEFDSELLRISRRRDDRERRICKIGNLECSMVFRNIDKVGTLVYVTVRR